MEFDGTPRFWYPRIAFIAWIDFPEKTNSSNFVDLREKIESLSLSTLSSIFFHSHPFTADFLPFLPLFVTSLSHFHFFSNLSFRIFSSLISFFFLFLFHFSPHFSFGSLSHVEIKWGKLPLTFPLATCQHHVYSLIFLYFSLFYLLHHVTHG